MQVCTVCKCIRRLPFVSRLIFLISMLHTDPSRSYSTLIFWISTLHRRLMNVMYVCANASDFTQIPLFYIQSYILYIDASYVIHIALIFLFISSSANLCISSNSAVMQFSKFSYPYIPMTILVLFIPKNANSNTIRLINRCNIAKL